MQNISVFRLNWRLSRVLLSVSDKSEQRLYAYKQQELCLQKLRDRSIVSRTPLSQVCICSLGKYCNLGN
jgi:hypothetical protein